MTTLKLVRVHDICPDTRFCRRCGSYLDTIVSDSLLCFEGVSAISHIRAKQIGGSQLPHRVLGYGERAKPGVFYDSIVLECLNEFMASRKMPEPAHTT